MLVGDKNNAAGAELAKNPTGTPFLILYDTDMSDDQNGGKLAGARVRMYPVMQGNDIRTQTIGFLENLRAFRWGRGFIVGVGGGYESNQEYYMAIVQERY